MRDDTRFVERLHRDLRDVRWPEPAEIRARARRRSRRTAAAVAVAVVVLLVVPVAVVTGRAGGTTAPAAAPSPPAGRVEIPRDALLRQEDLPGRTDLQLGEAGLGGAVEVAGLGRCAGRELRRQEVWVSRSQTLLRHANGGQRLDSLVVQDLHRMQGDGAVRFFADLRRQLAACQEWRETRSIDWGGEPIRVEDVHRWYVPRRDFAGDESLLLRHSVSMSHDPVTGQADGRLAADTTVVVRVGDLVTVLALEPAGEAELVRLAGVAAARMCAAANPSC